MQSEKFLYHATFKRNIESIKKNGLGNAKQANWSISKKGVTYFSDDAEVAFAFCEANAEVPDEVYDSGIVVLAIPESAFDEECLSFDENVSTEFDDDEQNYEYTKVIYPEDIFVITEDEVAGKLMELAEVPIYAD